MSDNKVEALKERMEDVKQKLIETMIVAENKHKEEEEAIIKLTEATLTENANEVVNRIIDMVNAKLDAGEYVTAIDLWFRIQESKSYTMIRDTFPNPNTARHHPHEAMFKAYSLNVQKEVIKYFEKNGYKAPMLTWKKRDDVYLLMFDVTKE